VLRAGILARRSWIALGLINIMMGLINITMIITHDLYIVGH
jgi:hypothetical protein